MQISKYNNMICIFIVPFIRL